VYNTWHSYCDGFSLQANTIQAATALAAQDALEGHGYFAGYTSLENNLFYPLKTQYSDCNLNDGVLRFMSNHDIHEIVRPVVRDNPDSFVSQLTDFSAEHGEGYPLHKYPNFYNGPLSRTTDVLVGSAGAYSAVHRVSYEFYRHACSEFASMHAAQVFSCAFEVVGPGTVFC
jgi:hypothetical protein